MGHAFGFFPDAVAMHGEEHSEPTADGRDHRG